MIPELTTTLTEADLRAPGFLDQLHEYIQFAAEVHSSTELEPWYRGMLQAIKSSPNAKELQTLLKRELAHMSFLCVFDLTEDELAHVFTADIASGLQIQAEDFDPWIMIRKRLATYPHWMRNDFKSRWLKELHQNGEVLTTNSIVAAGAQVTGTVMNWLKDYDLAMGSLAPADALKKANYVFKGTNILATPEPERLFVQRLVEVYERLKLNSLDPTTMEYSPLILGDDDRFKRIVDGVWMDLESGLPDAEYRAKFGVPVRPPVAPAAPTPAIPTPVTPKPKTAKRKKAAAPTTPPPAPAASKPQPTPARVAPPAPMTEVDIHNLPPTVIQRLSPAASSPQQKPQETGSLPTGSAQPTPGKVVFSDADEKEIASIQKAQKVFFKSPPGIDYDFVAKKVMGVHKLFFPSYDLERRFINLLVSYMKGVRDELEFKDVMTRPENTGGLNLTEEITDKILLTIQEEAVTAPQAKARKLSGPTRSQLTPSMKQVKKAMDQTRSTEGHLTPTGEMVRSVPPATPSPAPSPRRVTPIKRVPTVTPSAVRAPVDTGKPMVTDIKLPPKVMGPVEELANLTIQELRRLGPTLQVATEKVKGKIDILEKESLLKKAEGIRAWQNSPTNQLYLQLGQEALNAGRPVEDVLQQRQLSQQPSITKQEFDAIADLNRRLRY